MLCLFLLLIGTAIAAQVACDLNLVPDDNNTDLTYYNFAEKFMTAYCTGCHRSGGDGEFSLQTYGAVKGRLDEVHESVDEKEMPPSNADQPTDGDRLRLLAWIDAGAPLGSPDGGDDDAATPHCDVPDDPTWANFGQCFVDSYCVRCHSDPPKYGSEFPLVTEAQARAKGEEIRETLKENEMPPSEPYPTTAERDAMIEWANKYGGEDD
jgi:uncharacterized membrane protein